MRQVILILMVLINNLVAQAQIRLTSALVDSIICNLELCEPRTGITNSRLLLNFVSLSNQKNSIYYSSTLVVSRQDINENMMIYINDIDLYFVKVKNVLLDSGLQDRLIPYNDIKFDQAIDSIKFRQTPFSGVHAVRSPLVVYRIKQRCFSKNTFIISSRSYIPYLSAPEIFIPLKEVSDGILSDEIEPWYYDAFKNLNKRYYEDMKPREKMILRMQRKK